ncbi:hypothetical protein [Desulfovibrio inopinatus]|uniref:hypothetical protein n=1 Tax=Desulfovibrio inopinatus TaxID=102109 RepID=UPI0003F518B9|nr:hypothetical protein [Desulfovibrio inopinatus]
MERTVESSADAVETKKPFGLELSPVAFSVMSFLVIQVVSYMVWLLFVDPVRGVWKFYPQPFGAYLFWGILVLVFLGFNLGMFGLSKYDQPMRGLIATAITLLIAFAITALMIFGYGTMDPAFTATEGVGYGAVGLIVLIGFYGFGVLPTNMGGWPWTDVGLEQPLAGIAQIFVGFFLTCIGYVLLIYPSVASWTSPEKVLMPLPTAIGWFYSVIVSWLTTAQVLDHWPWTSFGSRAKTAIGAFIGNFILGTVIYFVFLALLKNVLIPAEAVEKIGAAITLWPAQLGVWIVFWMIFWPLAVGNVPNALSPAANRFVRLAITWSLGILSFVVYMRWFAMDVLNEASIVPGFGGDPLTWVDLLNFVMLVYILYFGSYGLVKKQE